MSSRRQPLHKCPKCGILISAQKKYCSPCADEVMREQGRINQQKRKRMDHGETEAQAQ